MLEGENMGITQRASSFLNYEIKIDLQKIIEKRLAYAIICTVAVLVTAAGYWVGENWFWHPQANYFEHQIERIGQNTGDAQSGAKLAMAAYLNGETAKAEGVLKELLAKDPGNPTAALYLGLILSDRQKYVEAIPLLTGYIKQEHELEARMAYMYLGKDYLGMGQSKQAFEYLSYAAAADSGNPVVYYLLGRASEKMSNYKQAVSFYEKALQLSPDYVEPDAALKDLAKKGSMTEKAPNSDKRGRS